MLFRSLHLFLELRLVVKHSLADGTKYEASYSEDNHVHQVCTICGKVTEIVAPQVTTSVNELLAEIGVDMEVFPTAEHLTSWAGLAPGNNESAGKKKTHTPTTATKPQKR